MIELRMLQCEINSFAVISKLRKNQGWVNLGQVVSGPPLIRGSFTLYEEFARAVEGWDLDFCQIGPPDGAFFLEQLAGTHVLISRAFFPSRFLQRGSSTPGYRTVSILSSADHAEAWRWCGETVTRNSLLLMPVSGEFESISMPHFDSIHLALSVEKLEQVAAEHFDAPLHELMPDERCFCSHGGGPLLALRRLLEGVTSGPGGGHRSIGLSLDLEAELAYRVLACLEQNRTVPPRGPRGRRGRVLEAALKIIESGPLNAWDASQLATATGVSRRTLENAFRDGLGVSPAALIKARRLGALARDLYSSGHTTDRVARLAHEHDFQHLGQLAADYRALFGELPSQTLRRSSLI